MIYLRKKNKTDDGNWDARIFDAHGIGANSVSWAPATIPGALVQITGGAPNVNVTKRFASGGCDNNVKIWSYRSSLFFFHFILIYIPDPIVRVR